MTDRHFFVQDDSSHWYMVPESKRQLWDSLSEAAENFDSMAWKEGQPQPDMDFELEFDKYRTGGGISDITFENPIIPK